MTVAEVAVLLGVDGVDAQAERMLTERMRAAGEGRQAPAWEDVR